MLSFILHGSEAPRDQARDVDLALTNHLGLLEHPRTYGLHQRSVALYEKAPAQRYKQPML